MRSLPQTPRTTSSTSPQVEGRRDTTAPTFGALRRPCHLANAVLQKAFNAAHSLTISLFQHSSSAVHAGLTLALLLLSGAVAWAALLITLPLISVVSLLSLFTMVVCLFPLALLVAVLSWAGSWVPNPFRSESKHFHGKETDITAGATVWPSTPKRPDPRLAHVCTPPRM